MRYSKWQKTALLLVVKMGRNLVKMYMCYNHVLERIVGGRLEIMFEELE